MAALDAAEHPHGPSSSTLERAKSSSGLERSSRRAAATVNERDARLDRAASSSYGGKRMKSADTDRQDDAVRRSSTRFDRTKSSSSRSDLVEARTSSRRAEPGAAARASTRREHFEREVPETVDENRRSSHRFDRAASRPEHEESAVDSRDHRRTSGRFERVPSSRARRARAGGGAEEEEEADSRRSSRRKFCDFFPVCDVRS